MIAQCTIGRNTKVEMLVLKMSTQTEIQLRQTTAQNRLVGIRNLTVTIDILIVAVTHLCARLIGGGLVLGSICIQFVKLCLSADDTLVIPTIELTDFLTDLSNVCTINLGVLARTLLRTVLTLALIWCFKAWSLLR